MRYWLVMSSGGLQFLLGETDPSVDLESVIVPPYIDPGTNDILLYILRGKSSDLPSDVLVCYDEYCAPFVDGEHWRYIDVDELYHKKDG